MSKKKIAPETKRCIFILSKRSDKELQVLADKLHGGNRSLAVRRAITAAVEKMVRQGSRGKRR